MKAFCIRVKDWIKSGADYSIMIVPIIFCLISFLLLRKEKWGLDAFRVVGIVMAILGLWTVVRSLSRESREHGQVGYHRSLVMWLYSARYIFLSPRARAGTAFSTGGGVIFGTSPIAATVSFNTIEEKVEYLLKRIIELQQGIDNNHSLIEQVRSDLKTELNAVKADAEQEIGNLKNKLKEKATIDYYFLISGTWLTCAGILVTSMPDKYMKVIFTFA